MKKIDSQNVLEALQKLGVVNIKDSDKKIIDDYFKKEKDEHK